LRIVLIVVWVIVAMGALADSVDMTMGAFRGYKLFENDLGAAPGDPRLVAEEWGGGADRISVYAGVSPFENAEVQMVCPVREYSVEEVSRLRQIAGVKPSAVVWSNVSRVILAGDGSHELKYIGEVADETADSKKPGFSAGRFRGFRFFAEAIQYAELFPERMVLGLICFYGLGTILFRRMFLLKKFLPLENIRAIDEGQG